MAAMSIDTFIDSYINFGEYNGLFPEEEIVLLRVAAAFYTEYVTNINKPKTLDEGWSDEPLIDVQPGDSGSMTPNLGTMVITVPSGPDGFKFVPVGDIPGFQNSTFAIYDSKMALVHELNHAILSLLGITSISNELIIASLASVAHDEIVKANLSSIPTHSKLLVVARAIRAKFLLPTDLDYYPVTSQTPIGLTPALRTELMTRASRPDGSYENVYNGVNRNFYGSSGLEKVPGPYRVGYVSHTNTGSAGPSATWTTLDQQWINYNNTKSTDYLNDPGRGENLVKNGKGIAWLGNKNDNAMRIDQLKDANDNVITDGGGHDYLDGGIGNDTLAGGKGNDTLIGGTGNDTYFYTTGDGVDTILDRDGQGSIVYDGITLNGGDQYGDHRVYRSADKKHTYTFVAFNSAQGDTVIIDGQMVVQKLYTGKLGLGFQAAPVVANPATTRNILGDFAPVDFDPVAAGVQTQLDDLGNVIVDLARSELDRVDTLNDSAGGDYIYAGGGDDRIYATRGGHDLIDAGAGRDRAEGGNGNDVILGGADGDILNGGNGDDRLYADTQISVAQAITNGNNNASIAAQGDWLAGGSGDDTLVGGDARDVLMGGGGSDLLIGGAGDDDIQGDADWVASSFAWTVTDGAGSVRTFSPTTGMEHPTDSAADVIYGGTGNDFLWGRFGNDVIFGEDGNDKAHGEAGNDIILGGAGQDILFGDDGEIPFGAPGDDYLDGGAQDDVIYGNEGNDILIGDTGDDILVGGAGNDTYIFNKGDGVDYVYDDLTPGANTYKFGPGVNPADIKLRKGSLLLDLGNGDQIHIAGFDTQNVFNSVTISNFQFDDGTVLTSSELLARGFDLDGTSGNDVIDGTNTTDRINGFAGDDSLTGNAGNDYLAGGLGNDYLAGGEGDDTYDMAGFGNDVILDLEGANTLQLVSGTQLDIGLTVVDGSGDLILSFVEGHTITLKNALSSANFTIRFADGTQTTVRDWVAAAILTPLTLTAATQTGATMLGGAGGDTLTGGAGNDTLYGAGGGDVLFGGEGSDVLDGGTLSGGDQYGDNRVYRSADKKHVYTLVSQAANDANYENQSTRREA